MAEVRVGPEPLDPTAMRQRVAHPAAGALVVFCGVVRDEDRLRPTAGVLYEAYVPMAERELAAIGREMESRWPASRVAMAHRTGELAVGEVSVVVAVATGHRAEAFEACRYGIEAIKARLPVWKKEHYRDGPDAWQPGHPLAGAAEGPGGA